MDKNWLVTFFTDPHRHQDSLARSSLRDTFYAGKVSCL
jgi:hypothetical protein